MELTRKGQSKGITLIGMTRGLEIMKKIVMENGVLKPRGATGLTCGMEFIVVWHQNELGGQIGHIKAGQMTKLGGLHCGRLVKQPYKVDVH